MKLSVIIPVYNQEELVIRCLDSIPKHDDMEIIAIDDGSEDNTLKVLKDYAKKCPQLKVVSFKQNKGVSAARNKGLNLAQGDFILFIDSDDYIYGDVFDEIYNEELGHSIDIVFYDMEDNNNTVYVVDHHRIFNRVGAFKFVRKKFIGNLRFKKGLQYGEDSEFHTKLMLKNPTFRCTGKVMYHYNYPREGSLTYLAHNHK